jgi:uncharacterized protein
MRMTRMKQKQNLPDHDGFTALHAAAASGCSSAIAPLFKAGLEIDEKTEHGNTPLILAAKRMHTESALILADSGGDLDTTNQVGDTALIVAAKTKNKKLTQKLLQLGADPFRRNMLGESAATLAEEQGGELAELLSEHRGIPLPFFN